MGSKYLILIGDGMADWPIGEIGNRTPLEAAVKPNMDFMASNGALGMVQVVPKEMYPGSDVSNLSILGYDPAAVYTGRSPLEAASMGIELGPDDVAVRCNIVSLKNEGADTEMESARVAGLTAFLYSPVRTRWWMASDVSACTAISWGSLGASPASTRS